jgi:hypothetical protein
MKKAVVLLTLLAMLIAPTVGFAASPWTEGQTYGERVSGKLQFGLTNVLLGWVDLFAEPNRAADKGENMWAGVGKGLVDTVLNTVGGAIHLVTFMIPADLPLPDNGVQLK